MIDGIIVQNDPVNLVDPWGEQSIKVEIDPNTGLPYFQRTISDPEHNHPHLGGAGGGAGKCASKSGKPGSYVPDRVLPTDKYGVPMPDANVPHTQLGRSKPKYGSEPQAREWDYGSIGNLQPKHDIDFTDHGYPDAHPDVPHKHILTPNNPKLAPQGGYQRGSREPL